MEDTKYLEMIRDNGLKEHLIKHPDGESSIKYRKTIALEIIAESLIKINANMNILTTVIEAVTNQGRSVNIDAKINKN